MVVALVLVGNASALANVLELGVNAGAKLNGMAGAGSAHVKGGTATVVNPAGLADTEQLDADLSFVGVYGTIRAPANGPGTAVHATSFVPLPMITAAYRLSNRVAAGVFVTTPSGAGATYDEVDFGVPGLPARPFGFTMYDVEGGPALGLRLPWKICLGVAYRVSWIHGTMKSYDPASLASGTPVYTETNLSGMDFTGFKLGVQANPIARLKLGMSYRTPVKVDLSGTTKVMAAADLTTLAEVDTSSQVRNVDKLLAGATYEWIEGKLITSLDYELQFYSRSRDITVVSPTSTTTIPQRFSNNNIMRLGAQYRIRPELPLRLGVGFFDNFRDGGYLSAASGGAPAPTYLLSAGAGYLAKSGVEVDLAYTFMLNRGSLDAAAAAPLGTPGDYSATTHAFSLSVGYRR